MLREYIKKINNLLEAQKNIVASGIIVVKFIDNEHRVLLLKKYDGTWDITKGKIDDGELSFDAALRETEEESGLNDIAFEWGTDSIKYGKGELFVGLTNSEPYIPVNPLTQKREHSSLKFVSFDEAINLVDERLKPGIKWAKSKVLG